MVVRSSLLLLAVCALATEGVVAAEGPDASSGFLTDYSLLKPPAAGQVGTYIYVAPNAVERLGSYNAVLIDQPAFAIAPDSKLKSLKPDDVKIIADAFRDTIADELATGYQIVDRPGKGVLGIRTSFSNVYVQKKGRGLLGYTPVGFVVTTAKSAIADDVLDKVLLTEIVLEAEMIDSVNGDVIAAVIDERGEHGEKKEFTSWQEVEAALEVYGKRIKCQLDNARAAAGARQDCTQIVVQQEKKQ